MAAAEQLFQLDQLDTELEQREAALLAIRRQLQRDPALAALETRLDTVRTQERDTALTLKRLEGDLAEVENRLKRDHGRLYGGTLVDPREIATLEREMERLRGRRGEVEEQVLEAMDRLEHLQHETARLSREANTAREQREADRPALTRQGQELLDGIAGLRAERERLAGELQPPVRAMYERLRRAAGHAVTRVNGGVCGSCRVNLPAKDVQHARAGAIAHCSNCARILYAGG